MVLENISIIAAMDKNRLISDHGKIPWVLPADLKHFRESTLNKPVIMGRKTYDEIGSPLEDRRNIIITRNKNLRISGCEVFVDINAALDKVKDSSEIMIIGGQEIYEKFLPLTQKMYLTIIDHIFSGDRYFPKWDPNEWQEIKRSSFKLDKENLYPYAFIDYSR
jgi:dihydrofolate reductase